MWGYFDDEISLRQSHNSIGIVADHFSIFGGLLASFASGVWHSL